MEITKDNGNMVQIRKDAQKIIKKKMQVMHRYIDPDSEQYKRREMSKRRKDRGYQDQEP